jgi:O-antigen ligase
MSLAGLALPVFFLVIMLSDTYLLGHVISVMFSCFSAILYKDYDGAAEERLAGQGAAA